MEGHAEGSLKKKVAAGIAVGAASTVAAGVAKKLLTEDEPDLGGDDERERRADQADGGRSRTASGRSTPKARSRTTSGRGAAKSSTRREKTRDQLYGEAKRLDIAGRSRMTKAQLARAVERARS